MSLSLRTLPGDGPGGGDSDQEATLTLTVIGIAAPGGNLTATVTNLFDADGTPSLTYRWQKFEFGNWQPITGANSAIFAVPNDPSWIDVLVRVVVETTDPKGGTTQVDGANITVTNQVIPPDNEAIGDLAIRGAREEGGTLAADFRNVSDADGATLVGYQ